MSDSLPESDLWLILTLNAPIVVEDYVDIVIDNSDLGRDWAPVLRWAIALDDGRLVFAAEGGLKLA